MIKIVKLISGLFFFSVLPLAGYGFFDISGYVSNTQRALYLAITIVNTLFSVFFVAFEGQQLKSPKTLIHENPMWFLQFQLLPFLNIIIAPLFDSMNVCPLPGGDSLRWAGIAVAVLSFALINLSVMSLGKFFTINLTIQEGHRLIQSGLYRYVRHPRYTGVILMSLSLALVFASAIGLLFTLAIMINLIVRIRREEKMLSAEFGAEWADYHSRTKALIPFIY